MSQQTTITQFKTENQIFADFVSLVQQALTTFNITGWGVRQLKQVFKVNHLKPTIFISIISDIQTGRQYSSKSLVDSQATRTNSNKQEVKIRFHATRIALASDTVETLTSNGVLKLISKWLQTPEGIKALSLLGYAQYRAEGVNNMDFTNDSENFQFMPFFDCTYLYTETFTTQVNTITKVINTGIYKI